jgi:pimeloyl-ACP methyl ester carboxylesterase
MADRYPQLSCPVAIVAGDADAVVDLKAQAQRLDAAVPGSKLDVFVGTGHMTHHADPARIVRAIDFANGTGRWPVEAPLRAANSA